MKHHAITIVFGMVYFLYPPLHGMCPGLSRLLRTVHHPLSQKPVSLMRKNVALMVQSPYVVAAQQMKEIQAKKVTLKKRKTALKKDIQDLNKAIAYLQELKSLHEVEYYDIPQKQRALTKQEMDLSAAAYFLLKRVEFDK